MEVDIYKKYKTRQSQSKKQKEVHKSNNEYKLGSFLDKNDVVVCAIAKHEDEYLEEWTKWYFDLGFDKIVLFDDNEDKTIVPSIPKIKEYVDNGKMKIIYCGNISIDYIQMRMYENFYNNNSFAWCAFFDIDEFLVLKKHNNIHEYLSEPMFSKYGSIAISWEVYGDNGILTKEEGNVVDRFKVPAENRPIEEHVKKIIRGNLGKIRFPNPHMLECTKKNLCCNERGDTVRHNFYRMKTSYEYAKLNHYITKSAEEFINKMLRGRAAQKVGVKRTLDSYFSTNPKTEDRVKALNHFLEMHNNA